MIGHVEISFPIFLQIIGKVQTVQINFPNVEFLKLPWKMEQLTCYHFCPHEKWWGYNSHENRVTGNGNRRSFGDENTSVNEAGPSPSSKICHFHHSQFVGRIFPSPKPATSSMRSRRPRPWPGTRHQFPWRHLHCAHIPDQEHNFINWFLNLSHLRQFSYISTNLFSLYEPFPAIQPPHEWALEKNPTSWHGIRSCVYEDQGLARPTHSLFEGFHGRPWSKLCHRLYTEEISIKSLNCLGLSGRTQFKKILFEMKYKIKHLLGRWDGICNMNMIVYSWHYIRMIKRHSFRCKNMVKMLEKTRCHTTTFFIGIVLVKPKCTFLHSVCSLHALLDIFPFIGRNTAVFCYSTLLYFVLYSTVSVLCPYCVCTATVV